MLRARKSVFLSALVLAASLPAFGTETTANSPFGLDSEVVGSLPESTQWVSERIGSYLYATYNSAELASQTITVGQYTSDFGSSQYAFPSVDYFTRLFSFASPESPSLARDFSIWGRYSLGFAAMNGQVSSSLTPINSSVTYDSLLVFNARIGALLSFDRWSWFKPYLGAEIDPYFFRNTADISGAEEQGENFSFGPVIGAHFPLFFNGRASLLAEYRKSIAGPGSGQIFADSDTYTAGLGLTF